VPRSEVMRDDGKGSTAAAAGDHAVRRSRSSAAGLRVTMLRAAVESAILSAVLYSTDVSVRQKSGKRAWGWCY
jgi:hypothetical protein